MSPERCMNINNSCTSHLRCISVKITTTSQHETIEYYHYYTEVTHGFTALYTGSVNKRKTFIQ